MRNDQVIKNWLKGLRASSSNGNVSTDGKNIFSYAMKIGRTLEDGTKQILDVRAPYSYSRTTSNHVSQCIWQANFSVRDGYLEKAQVVTPMPYGNWRYFPDEAPKEAWIKKWRDDNIDVVNRRTKERAIVKYDLKTYKQKFGIAQYYRMIKIIKRLIVLHDKLKLYMNTNQTKFDQVKNIGINIMRFHGIRDIKIYQEDNSFARVEFWM